MSSEGFFLPLPGFFFGGASLSDASLSEDTSDESPSGFGFESFLSPPGPGGLGSGDSWPGFGLGSFLSPPGPGGLGSDGSLGVDGGLLGSEGSLPGLVSGFDGSSPVLVGSGFFGSFFGGFLGSVG